MATINYGKDNKGNAVLESTSASGAPSASTAMPAQSLAPTSITSASLAPQAAISLPTPPQPTNYGAPIQSGNAVVTANTDNLTSLFKDYMTALPKPPSAAENYAQLRGQAGIETLERDYNEKAAAVRSGTARLRGVTARIAGITAEAEAEKLKRDGRHAPTYAIAGEQGAIDRSRAIKALPLQIEALATQAEVAGAQGEAELSQGILTQAKDHLTTVFQLHQQDAQNQYNYQRDVIGKVYEFADAQEKRRLDALSKEKEQSFQLSRDRSSYAQSLALRAIEYGQPMIAAQLAALDPRSPTYADDIAAIAGDIANPEFGGSTGLGVSPQDEAYAAQYASTGTIPTGVKGAQFGRIASIAKELPKAKGTIVDARTGIKSTSVGQAEQSDFAALQNIVENTKKLKELNAIRSQGIVGGALSGTIGNIISNTLGIRNIENEYLTVRKAIVDDLARMQTGAALTKDEQAFYNAYLPGRFSQAFFLGANSDQKIDSFASAMETRLETRMSAYGLASYGYTKVELPDGSTARVGDQVTNSEGVTGRILPDGSVSVPQQAPSSDAGPVSISIPKESRLAYVNNNPGNLKFVGQPGAKQGEKGFAKFDTPQAGYDALKRQIGLDVDRGLTLSAFVNKFAPPSENDTKTYINQVATTLGVSPSTRITREMIDQLARAVARKESSTTIT